jgi:hypothetical protein
VCLSLYGYIHQIRGGIALKWALKRAVLGDRTA